MAKQTMFEKAITDFKSGDSFKEQARNGQHPFVTFLEELAKSGCAVELRDDDVCMFNPQKRVVAIGARLGNAVLAGIGGLHELGHANTPALDPVLVFTYNFLASRGQPIPEELTGLIYGSEVAAWEWAVSVRPSEFQREFDIVRQSALASYKDRAPISIKNIIEQFKGIALQWRADHGQQAEG